MLVSAGGIKGGVISIETIAIIIAVVVCTPFLYFYSISLAIKSYKNRDKESSVLAAVLGSLCVLVFTNSKISADMYQGEFALLFFIFLIPCIFTLGAMLRLLMKIPEIIEGEENHHYE